MCGFAGVLAGPSDRDRLPELAQALIAPIVHRGPDGQETPIEKEKANEYRGLAPDERTVVLKVHGAIDRRDADRDSYVVAEDDYIDYAGGRDIAALLPATLLAKLRQSQLLFLGYSPGDWSPRVFFRRIWREHRFDNYPSWSVNASGQPGDERFWRRRSVDSLAVSLEELVAAVAERLESLPPKGSGP